jgi:hypothetical protein
MLLSFGPVSAVGCRDRRKGGGVVVHSGGGSVVVDVAVGKTNIVWSRMDDFCQHIRFWEMS